METQEKSQEREIYKVTLIGSAVNFFLLIFKFIAGILGNSGALVADAVHSLSDFVTDIIVILFVRISKRPEDKRHPYGHGKFETLATAIIGALLFGVGLSLLWGSVQVIFRYFRGEVLESPGYLALAMAIISVITKEVLYRYTLIFGERIDSKIIVANAWHHRSDALSSVGSTIGIGGAILLGESWRVLDPLAALIVSFMIIKVGIQLLMPCLDELLEGNLPDSVETEIRKVVQECEEVSDLHHLRTRRVGNYYAIEMHLRMDGNKSLYEAHQKATEVEKKIKDVFGKDTYINIHVEPWKYDSRKGDEP